MISLAVNVLFLLILACSILMAFAFGRRTERVFVFLLIAASVGTLLATPTGPDYQGRIDIIRLIDWVILVVAWGLALKSDRFWPIWFAAMQTLSVLTELASWHAVGIPHLIFTNLAAFWSLPALIVMAYGTMLDWRKRASASLGSPKPDWLSRRRR